MADVLRAHEGMEPTGRPETDLVNEAVKTLGLEPFDPAKKIIEYILK